MQPSKSVLRLALCRDRRGSMRHFMITVFGCV
jgi:hypothetical protein